MLHACTSERNREQEEVGGRGAKVEDVRLRVRPICVLSTLNVSTVLLEAPWRYSYQARKREAYWMARYVLSRPTVVDQKRSWKAHVSRAAHWTPAEDEV